MKIAEILKTKGDVVFTIAPHEPVSAAAAQLNARKVGALVVMDGDRVAGILSERDVVRLVATIGPAGLERPVSSCMTIDVVFAEPGEHVDALLSRMTDRRIRHLPVCRNDRLVGLVSIGDLVKLKIAQVEAEADGLKAYITAG